LAEMTFVCVNIS